MTLLFEPKNVQEAQKLLLNAKNEIEVYFNGLSENERKNILSDIVVRDFTRNGDHYSLDKAPRPEIKFVIELKKICKELSATTTSQKIYTDQDYYITAKQVQEICGVSQTKSYSIIRDLNEELEKKGYITIRGKVLKSYFLKKIGVGA